MVAAFIPFVVLMRQTNLTVEFPPTPLPVALSILSEQSGHRLTVSPAFLDEVIVVCMKDAPYDSMLRHLAEAFCAKWQTRSDGSLMLVKDPIAIRRREQERRVYDAKILDSSLQYFANRLRQQPIELDAKAIQATSKRQADEDQRRKNAEAANDYAHMFTDSSAREETPSWRALARLVARLDRRELLSMPNDAREVWSDKPTSMQHPLPASTQEILDQFRREELLLHPNEKIASILLVMKKWELSGAFNVWFVAKGTSGKPIDSAFARMNADSEMMKKSMADRPSLQPIPGEKTIEVPKMTVDARRALSSADKAADHVALFEKWQPKFLDPVRFEPTQWHQGADILAAASAAKVNLIGTVSDTTGGRYYEPKPQTPSQVLSKSQQNLVHCDDGWIVSREWEARTRASRSEAKQLLADSIRQGGISIDSAANWSAKTNDKWPFTNWVGDYIAALFSDSGPLSASRTILDEDALRLWAFLGDDVRVKLKRGDTLEVSGLSAAVRSLLARMVYWFVSLDEDVEPTDVLPDGILAGQFKMSVTEQPVFVGWSSKTGEPKRNQPLNATYFGTFLAKGNRYWEVSADAYRAFDRFRMGISRVYSIKFEFGSTQIPMTVKLNETLFDPKAEVVAKLPEAVQLAVEKARLTALSKLELPSNKGTIPPQSRN